MASIEIKSMDSPDEMQTPAKATASVVHLGTATVKRLQAEPGFRWSECIKPLVGGESCETAHLGYIVSGTLHVAADDGAEADIGPGDAYRIDPGHDAWVLGDEPVVALEFELCVGGSSSPGAASACTSPSGSGLTATGSRPAARRRA